MESEISLILTAGFVQQTKESHCVTCCDFIFQDFEVCNGIEEVAVLIRDKQMDENLRFFSSPSINPCPYLVFPSLTPIYMIHSYFWLVIRLKCGEFLLLLIGHVNGRGRPPLATIHEDIRQLLGEKSASLIWAASQFGSTLDPEQRLTALHIQARRVLESLDLY